MIPLIFSSVVSCGPGGWSGVFSPLVGFDQNVGSKDTAQVPEATSFAITHSPPLPPRALLAVNGIFIILIIQNQ